MGLVLLAMNFQVLLLHYGTKVLRIITSAELWKVTQICSVMKVSDSPSSD